MTWDVYDGDVLVMLALRSISVWRTTASWRSRSSWGMVWDQNNVQRWTHKNGFHNRGVPWDKPMARWAGEGKDWTELMTQTRPQKEDVIRNLLKSMKQPVEKKRSPKDLCRQRNQEIGLSRPWNSGIWRATDTDDQRRQ